jgi:membrane-associated phospholipid phosphatase
MKKIFSLFACCLIILITNGQDDVSKPEKIYKLNYKAEIPATIGLFGLNILGFTQLTKKPTLDTFQVNSLNKNDVWAFDRIAVNQSYPAPSNIYSISDIGLWTSYFLPGLLFIDDEIRKSWGDIVLLYFETQAINLNIYVWGGPAFTSRVRPMVYYEEASWNFKLGKEATDSFFSGHVAIAAGASFFMAKVLSDYHPELGKKKWWLYSAALIPPAFVGYTRYRGLMHFPTDILMGAAMGAVVGILVPHLHKITSKKSEDLSIVPFAGRYSGLAFSMRF